MDIHSARTRLQDLGQDDQPLIFQGLSNPEVVQFYGVSFESLEATAEQMEWYHSLEQQGTGKWWKVLGSNKEFIGAGGLNDFNAKEKTIEIGFWLLPEYWGKGYMTEVIPTICSYAFEHFKIDRIVGIVETENLACRKALEKLGFKHEGKSPTKEMKDGIELDLRLYSFSKSQNSTESLRIGMNLLNALKGIIGH